MEIPIAIGKFFLDVQESTGIENVLKIVIGVFSLLLLADNVKFLATDYNDVILLTMTLAILALFFLAVVRRN